MLGISLSAMVGKIMGGGRVKGAEKRSIKMPSRCQFTVFPLFISTLCSEIFVCTSLPICLPPRSLKHLQKHPPRIARPVMSHLHLKMKEYECYSCSFASAPQAEMGLFNPHIFCGFHALKLRA